MAKAKKKEVAKPVEEEATKKEPSKFRKKLESIISVPLFTQSFKSMWVLWLALTIGSAFIFVIINIAVGSKNIFTNIQMDAVSQYVSDEGLSWLKILGLLDKMGFSLTRIQIMSQIDLNSIMNELVYKIAGVLLPMIYVMICANRLIAAQVHDGSMAYILSTPTNRKTVVRTQYLFLLLSIIAMYIIIFIAAFSSEAIANSIQIAKNPDAKSTWNPITTPLFCFGSFLSMFALGGIAFGASGFFNKSNYSVAVGGGACIVSFLCCILGLFGNKVFVAVGIGVKAMSIFNYLSIFTLVDNESMSNFAKAAYGNPDVTMSFNWIWELAILVAIGAVFAYIGGRRFVKKDLPL